MPGRDACRSEAGVGRRRRCAASRRNSTAGLALRGERGRSAMDRGAARSTGGRLALRARLALQAAPSLRVRIDPAEVDVSAAVDAAGVGSVADPFAGCLDVAQL